MLSNFGDYPSVRSCQSALQTSSIALLPFSQENVVFYEVEVEWQCGSKDRAWRNASGLSLSAEPPYGYIVKKDLCWTICLTTSSQLSIEKNCTWGYVKVHSESMMDLSCNRTLQQLIKTLYMRRNVEKQSMLEWGYVRVCWHVDDMVTCSV